MLIRREIADILTKTETSEKEHFVSWKELSRRGLILHLKAVEYLTASIGLQLIQTGEGIIITNGKKEGDGI